jgi:hypothetical protein
VSAPAIPGETPVTIRSLAALACLAAAPALAEEEGRPPVPGWQTDAACTWTWSAGGGFGLWTERCELSTGLWEILWDEDAGAFVQEVDGERSGIVVQPFPYSPADPETLRLSLLSAGGLGPEAPCILEGAAIRPAPRTVAFLVLMPTVPDALAPTPEGEVPDPLCGPYGASTHGVRYVVTDLRWPGLAVFVEEGQERPMFDPASLTALAGG